MSLLRGKSASQSDMLSWTSVRCSFLLSEKCEIENARMVDDSQLAMYGTEISVQDEKHLELVCGKPTKDAPCKEWYLDPNPARPKYDGYEAILQRHSRCLAYIRLEHVRSRGSAFRLL